VRGAGVRELKAELRENQGWPLVIKGELHQVFKFKLRNQVRGAGLRNFMHIIISV